jgi:hypothetical protein
MRQMIARDRTHTAEPVPGSFRAALGGDADLFDLNHYPVHAVCQVCREPIKAETFLRAFRHASPPRPETRTETGTETRPEA